MELHRIEREVKGWGSLWDLRGNTIIESRFFVNFSYMPRVFDATGILFRECIFENCEPRFEHYDGEYGLIGCKILPGKVVK